MPSQVSCPTLQPPRVLLGDDNYLASGDIIGFEAFATRVDNVKVQLLLYQDPFAPWGSE